MTHAFPRKLIAMLLLTALIGSQCSVPYVYAQEAIPETPVVSEPEAPAEEVLAESEETPPEEPVTTPEPEPTEETPELLVEPATTSGEESLPDTATSTPESSLGTSSPSIDLEITTSSEEASTSSGTSTPSTDGPVIVSGKSIALLNILNLVNANFVNSEGAILFGNFADPFSGTIDLRTAYNGEPGTMCDTFSCGNEVLVNVENDASIDNTLLVQASSGGNTVSGDGSQIHTGNAYAGLNLVNIANANIIDSEYLLVTMNAFDSVNGDIVFPSLEQFLRSLAGSVSGSLALTNTAEVTNAIDVTAGTGNNTSEDGSIYSGSANGTTNVFNEINTSFGGGGAVTLLLRVHGSWAGEIFGAPPGLAWTPTPSGGLFVFDSAGGGNGSNATIDASNTALINNDISVIALTGENRAEGQATLITTGNAHAAANVVNIANTNVVGKNWILAIINIFGDFNGNIAFGRPDIWVGAQASVPSKLKQGDIVEYTFSVINNGDSTASHAVLVEDYDEEHMDIVDASVAYTKSEAGNVEWDIGTLPPGSGTEITYRARVVDARNDTEITSTVSVEQRETDDNMSDNTDTITIRTAPGKRAHPDDKIPRPVHDLEEEAPTFLTLSITRSLAHTSLTDTREAQQTLTIINPTDYPAYNVEIADVLSGPDGTVISEEPYSLGTVQPHEEITISYDVAFSGDAPNGTYRLVTHMRGTNVRTIALENGSIAVVSAPVFLAGEVLGTFTEAVTLDTPVAEAATLPSLPEPTDKPYVSPFLFSLLLALVAGSYLYLRQERQ